jgi:hypothetical protein
LTAGRRRCPATAQPSLLESNMCSPQMSRRTTPLSQPAWLLSATAPTCARIASSP